MRPFWAPLRYRNFRLVWIAQTVSSIGSSLQAVALPWMIISQAHNSTLSLALALLSLALPQALLTLVGGFLVDLLDARSVMLWADAARILTAGSIAGLSIMPTLHFWILCSILLLHGTANALFAPAAASIVPHLVAKEHQTSANALSSMMVQIGPVLGYLPAGILVASLGPAWAFSLNALSYAFACLLVIRTTPLLRRQHKHKASALEEISESVRYLRTLRWLLALLVMDMFLALAAITTNSIGLPLLAKAEQAGARGLSMLLWGYSCGAVVGMFLPSLLVFRSHRGLLSISFQCIEAALIFPFRAPLCR
jgi:MFS transporter, DHA3 family, tetracycline resistance protein